MPGMSKFSSPDCSPFAALVQRGWKELLLFN